MRQNHTRQILAGVLVIVLLLEAGPIHAQTDLQATVIPHRLNVREAPDLSAPAVGQVAGGDEVRVTGREDDPHDSGLWVFITTPDGALSGWALADYLTFEPGADLSALPRIDRAGASAEVPQPAPGEGTMTGVTTVAMNFRAGPGTGFAVLRTPPEGSRVLLTARTADGAWVKGSAGGQKGWVYKALERVSGDSDGAPGRGGGPAAPFSAPDIPAGVVPVIGPRAARSTSTGRLRATAARLCRRSATASPPARISSSRWAPARRVGRVWRAPTGLLRVPRLVRPAQPGGARRLDQPRPVESRQQLRSGALRAV